jgi:hypothetical protein
MTDRATQANDRRVDGVAPLVVIAAATFSALLGAGAGILMAYVAPGDKFSWAGLAVAPLWLLLEIVFELIVGIFGAYSRIARVSVTSAVLLGFYIAWFSIRPL